jgi:hypothetical protein
MGWEVNDTLPPLCPRERDVVPMLQDTGWASEPVWTSEESNDFLGNDHTHIYELIVMVWTSCCAELQNGSFQDRHFYGACYSALRTISFVFINSFSIKMFLTRTANVKN